MSEDDGLREAIETGVLGFVWSTGDAAAVADVVLALPEVTELRAQAAAVQRVRELHQPDEDGDCPECFVMFADGTCRTIRALVAEEPPT